MTTIRRKCLQCPLGSDQPEVRPVYPDGPRSASILFLGEAPGQNEDEQGRPFIGRAGNVLQGLLEKLGLRREQVLVTNMAWCRPPENRTPTDDEVQRCTRHHLWPFLGTLTRLRLVVTLGKTAMQWVLGSHHKSVFDVAGKARHWLFGAYWTYPMLHPAATFRSGVAAKRWEEDGSRLRRLLDRDFFLIKAHHGPRRTNARPQAGDDPSGSSATGAR